MAIITKENFQKENLMEKGSLFQITAKQYMKELLKMILSTEKEN
jgi:hypothetical protein